MDIIKYTLICIFVLLSNTLLAGDAEIIVISKKPPFMIYFTVGLAIFLLGMGTYVFVKSKNGNMKD